MNVLVLVFEQSDADDSFYKHDWKHIQSAVNYPELRVTVDYYCNQHQERNTRYSISDGKIEESKLPPVKTKQAFMDMVKSTCLDHYKPGMENAVFFSMHCYIQSLWAYKSSISLIPLVHAMMARGYKYEFIVMDCCYNSSLNAAIVLHPICKYLVGCESASPNLGYLHSGLMLQLSQYSESPLKVLKNLSKSFILRNDRNKHVENLHYTDSVVLDLGVLPGVLETLEGITLERNPKALAEPSYKVIYDLIELVMLSKDIPPDHQLEIIRAVESMVITYRQSVVLKDQDWSKRLHGLSIGLGRHKPCGIKSV